MPNVLPFEPPAARGAALPPAPLRPPHEDRDQGVTFSMQEVARQLGVGRRGESYKASYIADLIAHEGFPAPLPIRVAGALSREVHPRKSRWLGLAVRAWFLAQVPPHAVARVADAEALEAAAAAADRLDTRADNLFGGAA